MPDDARAALERRQAQLLRAMQGAAAAPSGFDASRVRLAGESLARKRARAVARAWPRLAASLSPRFDRDWADFAAIHPWPPPGGPLADGWLFARWLQQRAPLPDEAAAELARVRLRLRWHPPTAQLVQRRGPAIVAARLRAQAQLVIGIRLWRSAECWVRLPMGLGRRPTAAHPTP